MEDTSSEAGPDAVTVPPRGSILGWVLSFLLFPYGPFVYLARLRAVAWWLALLLVIVSAVVHVGLVSVLSETNHEPWQIWLVLLMGAGLYILGMLQFVAGERHKLWGPAALWGWRIAAWLFGVFLLLGVVSQIALFHLLNQNS